MGCVGIKKNGEATPSPQTEEQQPNETGNVKPPTSVDIAKQKALKQLKSMTLDQKLGELIIAGMEGNTANIQTKKMIQNQYVGGVIFYKNNVSTPKGLVTYVNQLKTWNRKNPTSLIISVDQEGGKVSRLPGLAKFPNASVIGKSNNVTNISDIGRYLGKASKVMGMNVDYAPVLDINSNPNNPVIGVRSYGASANVVSRTGIKVMKGIQAEDVIPVVKHFPGHGDTSVDSHLDLPVVYKSLSQLQSFEWIPFKNAINNGADSVMIAHILFPKIDSKYPASLSKVIITDQLRGTLGFKGVVITDDLTMGAIAKHYGIGEAAVQALTAGSDILLVAHGYENVTKVISSLKKSIDSGRISEKRIDESVLRILLLKQKYKLTDRQTSPTPELTELNKSIRRVVATFTI